MNAIELLEEQHRQVEDLFKQIEKAKGAMKGRLFDRIADALAIHASIEEQLFYPSVKGSETEDILRESVEEHLSVKRIIADLMDSSPSDDQFDAKILLLKEQVAHHVREERTELFPKVKKMDGVDLDELGAPMEAMAAELEAKGNARAAVPEETDAPAPLD